MECDKECDKLHSSKKCWRHVVAKQHHDASCPTSNKKLLVARSY